MGLDTRIYCNHTLSIPNDTNDIVELLISLWNNSVEFVDSIDIKEEDLIIDPNHFKVLVNPKLIEFEYNRYQQIRINTNFRFSGYIIIYPKTIQFTPLGLDEMRQI